MVRVPQGKELTPDEVMKAEQVGTGDLKGRVREGRNEGRKGKTNIQDTTLGNERVEMGKVVGVALLEAVDRAHGGSSEAEGREEAPRAKEGW